MKSNKEPFIFSVPEKLTNKIEITLNFKGNYGECPLPITLSKMKEFTSQIFAIVYDLKKKEWS